jgi:hypothetical protein
MVPRQLTRLACLRAFLPDEAIDMLASIVTNRIVLTRTQQQLNNERHYTAIRPLEIWTWIAQRLDISLRVKMTIDGAYKSQEVQKVGWLPKYRFTLINGNMDDTPDKLLQLTHTLCSAWQTSWEPGNVLVIDESIFEHKGSNAPTVTIPRKPHPVGLLVYGISGYTSKLRLPMLLDIEPRLYANQISPRKAARSLLKRTQEAHIELPLHIVADSAFGSFEELKFYLDNNVVATMSIADKDSEWLWEMLRYDCPLNQGRTAQLSIEDRVVVASLYRVKKESGKFKDILTATSAFSFEDQVHAEPLVRSVGKRRVNEHGYSNTRLSGKMVTLLGSSLQLSWTMMAPLT